MDGSLTARAIDQLDALLASVTDDQLDDPTPCARWTVSELIDHLVETTSRLAATASGEQVDWGAPEPHHEDILAMFRAHGAELLAAVNEGEGWVPEGMVAGELGVHTWDLASAMGRDSLELDAEIAEAGYEFMSRELTDDRRGDRFEPARPEPEGVNAYERLAAFTGREVPFRPGT